MRVAETIAACALLCLAACGKPAPPLASEPAVAGTDVAAAPASSASPAGPPTPTAMPDATPALSVPSAVFPDDDPACADLSKLAAALRMWRVAASPGPHRTRARALWPTLPPACRGGTFFLAAAELVGFADDANLPTADGALAIHSPADALARGLAAEPDHPRLLAHLALVDDLAPSLQAPAIPADACARAKARGAPWSDYTAYICALAAIHVSDGATALTELDRIRDVALFPDLKARRAQALALAGKRKEARALAKPAAAALSGPWPFDVPEDAIAALKKKLAQL